VIKSRTDGRNGTSRRQAGNGSNASVRRSSNTCLAVKSNAA
jgi:hypothetical protein